jgi:hypothetical protein
VLVVVAVVAAVVAAATYVTWLAGRLDRLHARTDGARASLDAHLVRRAAAATLVADSATLPPDVAAALAEAARRAARAEAAEREATENDLSRALRAAAPLLVAAPRPLVDDLAVAAGRVVLARRFYNDAVRDTRVVRERRLVRWLHLAGHAPPPAYFEIDDTPPPGLDSEDRPHPL